MRPARIALLEFQHRKTDPCARTEASWPTFVRRPSQSLTRTTSRNTVLAMQNVVPQASISVEQALADRALAGRRDAYAAEVRKLIDAAFAVTRRTGSVEPQVRDIVREAGL